jgi:hypothetical protein
MAFNIMTLFRKTLSTTAFSLIDLIVTLSVKDMQHNATWHKHLCAIMLSVVFYCYVECHYAYCHYCECQYAECRDAL